MINKKTKILTLTAVFTAISIVLSYFEIPIIPAFPFLKLDFAEIPVILCSLFLGPIWGIASELIRNAFALLMTGTATLGVGTLSNFILGSAFILVLYCYTKNFKHKYNIISGLLVSSLALTILAVMLNMAIFIPLYKMVGGFPRDVDALYFVLVGILPLNIIKWPLISIISAMLYKSTHKIFDRSNV